MGFHQPREIGEAWDALAAGASVIAGGTDWYPLRGEGPFTDNLLDITRLSEFRGISCVDGGWRIGAATTWSDIASADLPSGFTGLRQAARLIGARQIQNVGTIGGNLCNASPAADGMPPLLTLEARVTLVSANGTRDLPLAEFVTGVRRTAIGSNELLQSLFVPDPGSAKAVFQKLGARTHLVISIAMVSVLLRIDRGVVSDARIAVGACSPVAQRMPALEGALRGCAVSDIGRQVTPEILEGLHPITDVRGSADYRLDAVAELIRRALSRAKEV